MCAHCLLYAIYVRALSPLRYIYARLFAFGTKLSNALLKLCTDIIIISSFQLSEYNYGKLYLTAQIGKV